MLTFENHIFVQFHYYYCMYRILHRKQIDRETFAGSFNVFVGYRCIVVNSCWYPSYKTGAVEMYSLTSHEKH